MILLKTTKGLNACRNLFQSCLCCLVQDMFSFQVQFINVYCDQKAGCGIFFKSSNTRLSHILPKNCSVFQAEVMAIFKSAEFFQSDGIFPENFMIYCGSQAAIRSLTNVISTFILVFDCQEFLNKTSSILEITLL